MADAAKAKGETGAVGLATVPKVPDAAREAARKLCSQYRAYSRENKQIDASDKAGAGGEADLAACLYLTLFGDQGGAGASGGEAGSVERASLPEIVTSFGVTVIELFQAVTQILCTARSQEWLRAVVADVELAERRFKNEVELLRHCAPYIC